MMSITSLNKDLFSAVSEKKEQATLNRLFGKILASSSFQTENSVARCGCYLCQARSLITSESSIYGPVQVDYYVNPEKTGITLDQQHDNLGLSSSISSSPAALNLNDSSTLVLDSLSELNSPLIASLLVNAKWGDIDPDSGTATNLSYYISQPDDVVDAGGETFAPVVDVRARMIFSLASPVFMVLPAIINMFY